MATGTKRFLHCIYNPGLQHDEKGREYFFDNAKFILIMLVVLAHAISPYRNYSDNYLTFWNVTNTLHMPCLIFISGFFAKRYIGGAKGINVQRPFTYLVLYVVAQISVSLFEAFVLDINLTPSFLSARSSLWFLQCLLCWYIMLPVVEKYKAKYAFPFFLVVGLAIGYEVAAGNVAALSRMIVHFPFFLAGFWVSKERLMKIVSNKYVRLCALPVIAITTETFYVFKEYIPAGIITCNKSYASIEVLQKELPFALHWVGRLLFYVAAALLIIAFLAIVPRGKTFFSRFGSRTLQVYILHRFLYLAELELEWWKPLNTVDGRMLMVLIAVVLTFVLSLKIFSYPFVWQQSIKIQKLRKD